jgi:hypothetical protein
MEAIALPAKGGRKLDRERKEDYGRRADHFLFSERGHWITMMLRGRDKGKEGRKEETLVDGRYKMEQETTRFRKALNRQCNFTLTLRSINPPTNNLEEQ